MTDPSLILLRWWPLLLWPLAAWHTWHSLRTSLPRPDARLARILAALRLTLWSALLVLSCGPRLRWSDVERRPAELAVLLDNSASVAFLDGRLDHGDWLPALRERLEGVRLRVFTYDGGLREMDQDAPPVLKGDGVETDLDGALAGVERAMQERNWTGLLLVGDGNPTRGDWPVGRAARLGVRIWTAGTGRLRPQADLVLRSLEGNERARVGRPQTLSARLEAAGLAGRRAVLVLSEGGRELARQALPALADGSFDAELRWTPARAGHHLLRLEARLDGGGEASPDNNHASLQVRVDEARLPILLLAGRPSPDLAFLRSALEAREDLDVLFAMPERPGADRQAILRSLGGARLLVLAHWPPAGARGELVKSVARELERVPSLWLDGAGCGLEILRPGLDRVLRQEEGPAEGARATRLHPVLGPEERLAELQGLLDELPPLVATRRAVGALPDVLLEGARSGRPLLLAEEREGVRHAWLPVRDLWRWGVGSQLSLGENRRARDFVGRLADWLLAAGGQGLLQVRPDRAGLPSGAPLAFEARLREETGGPRDGASVTIDLESDTLVRRLELEPLGEGRYTGRLAALPAGDWSWRAVARQGDRPELADSGHVLVEGRSPETLDATRGQRLLDELAAAGGGRAFDLDDPAQRTLLADGSALDSLERRPLLARQGRQWEALGSGWLLGALLLLLAAEWILRRLRGML